MINKIVIFILNLAVVVGKWSLAHVWYIHVYIYVSFSPNADFTKIICGRSICKESQNNIAESVPCERFAYVLLLMEMRSQGR